MALAALLVQAMTVRADLTHLYTFNDGMATDLVGNADGAFVGNASVSGGKLILPGGGLGITGDHLSLLSDGADGINIAGYSNATFELWATAADTDTWARYFDFGGKSLSGPGAAGNSIFLTVHALENGSMRATISNVNINTQTGNLNEDEASASPAAVPLTGPGGVLGVERHVVVTFNGSANQMLLYYEGNLAAQNLNTDNMLELLQESYALLGASLYNNDRNFNGSINEFRIYNHVLSASAVMGNYITGPTVEVPEPSSALALMSGAMCLFWWRKQHSSKQQVVLRRGAGCAE